jgi:1,4-alpha-glucan branching enzyme
LAAPVQASLRIIDHAAELVVIAPKGEHVEVEGDFTNWSPVDMSRADGPGGSQWHIALPPGRALVRLRVRVDGGTWIVPGGLARARDAFGDDVGALVINATP